MAKFRPSEVKLVSNLLDPDSPDSEGATELAKEIIESLDKSRGKREGDRKSTRLNSSHSQQSRMPSSA